MPSPSFTRNQNRVMASTKHFKKFKRSLLTIPKFVKFDALFKRKLRHFYKRKRFKKLFRRRKRRKTKYKLLRRQYWHRHRRRYGRRHAKRKSSFWRNFSTPKNRSFLLKEAFFLKKRKAFLRQLTLKNTQFTRTSVQPFELALHKQTLHFRHPSNKATTRNSRNRKRRNLKKKKKEVKKTSWKLFKKATSQSRKKALFIRYRKNIKLSTYLKLNKINKFGYNSKVFQKIKSKTLFNYSQQKMQAIPKIIFAKKVLRFRKKTLRFQVITRTRFVSSKRRTRFNNNYRLYWAQRGLNKKPYVTRTLPLYQKHSISSSTFTESKLLKQKSPKDSTTELIQAFYVTLLHHNFSTTNGSLINHLNTYTQCNLKSDISVYNLVYKNQITNIINTKQVNSCLWNVKPSTSTKNSVIQTLNIYTKPSSCILPSLLKQWLYENNFIYPENAISKKTTYVLSRVPSYKMVPNSPVSADKFRGNMHKKLGILTDGGPFLRVPASSLLFKFNYLRQLNQISRTLKVENLGSTLKKIVSKRDASKLSKVYNLFFLRGKVVRLFTQTLKRRLRSVYNHLLKKIPATSGKRKYLAKLMLKKKKIFLLKPITRVRKKYFRYKKLSRYAMRRQRRRRKLIIRNRYIRKLRRRVKKKKYPLNRQLDNVLYYVKNKVQRHVKTTIGFRKINLRRRKFYNKLTKLDVSAQNAKRNNFPVYKKHIKKSTTVFSNTTHSCEKLNVHNMVSSFVNHKSTYSQTQVLLTTLSNITLLKSSILLASPSFSNSMENNKGINVIQNSLTKLTSSYKLHTNLVPETLLDKKLSKIVLNSFKNSFFQENVISWYHNTMIRFIEDCTGKKILFQFYPFMSQDIDLDFIVRYKRWLPRMVFYERRLGHRFFLEEALHIIHLSFYLKDPKIMCSWLKAMILRISFWKTRSIFRFLKYLFFNYFQHVFSDLKVKGLKIRLKGKISAAGNSRKRTILYRIGKTSHSTTSLRVLNEFTTINTFTGVMGFNLWIFY